MKLKKCAAKSDLRFRHTLHGIIKRISGKVKSFFERSGHDSSYPFYAGFNLFTFLANWIKLVCFNFPFALLSQLFFIQPLVRTVFKALFVSHPITARLRHA